MFLAMTAALLAAQAEAAALAPAGKWTIDYGSDRTLTRAFASPRGEVTFGLRPNIGQPGGELVVVLPGAGGGRKRFGRAVVGFGSARDRYEARYARVPVIGEPFHGVTLEPVDGMWAALSGASEITVEAAGEPALRLAVGRVDRAMAALRTCQEAQLRLWGADPASLITGMPSEKSIGRAYNASFYPQSAIMAGEEGRVIALLEVDRGGAVTNRRAVRSVGPALDAATCARTGRLSYPAAPDGPGKRWAVLSVRWWMP